MPRSPKMPRFTWTKHSFSAGELSPQICQSRMDLSVHDQGVSESNNLVPLRTGSLVSRPDSLSYDDCKLQDKARRIISFNLTNGVYVLLVFGHKQVSIVSLGDGSNWVPKEWATFPTPYYYTEASNLDYAVYGQLMVLVHPNHPPYSLVYTSRGYQFSMMNFSPSPWLGDGIKDGIKYGNVSLSIEGTDGDNLCTIRSGVDIFDGNDVGRNIRLGCIPSPRQTDTKYPVNVFMTAGGRVYQSIKEGTTNTKVWGDDVKEYYVIDGGVEWKLISAFNTNYSKSSSVVRTSVAISPYYVWGTIAEVKDDKRTIRVRPKSKNSFISGDVVDEWFLSAWGNGKYPSHVTFYQNRLVFSGVKDDDLSVYLSSDDNFHDFSPDGDYGCTDLRQSLSMSITDNSVSEIKWLVPFGGGLLVGCDDSIWMLSVRMAQGLDVDFRRISGSGVYSCSPVSVGDCLFFVFGSGRRVKALSGSIEQGFRFLDVTQLAGHLFKNRVKGLVYQEEPHSVIWVVLEDYGMLGCRFSSEGEGDFAWHKHTLRDGDSIESIASFPSVKHGDTSVWLLVNKARGDVALERLGDFS